jgi:hypothetical protein
MLGALAAACGALLAVGVVVGLAELGAVVTHFGAQGALLFAELAVSGHQTDAGLQLLIALYAAVGAFVHGFLAGHFCETDLAVDQAFLAYFQALYVRRID